MGLTEVLSLQLRAEETASSEGCCSIRDFAKDEVWLVLRIARQDESGQQPQELDASMGARRLMGASNS